MFEQAVQAGQAMQRTIEQGRGMLVPARSGCRTCQTTQMIAAPVLGRCEHCGSELTVRMSAMPRDGKVEATDTFAA